MAVTERYQRFKKEEFILRDQLAIDRTKLSNDRTFLAYSRTALTLFIAGVTALKFVTTPDIVLDTLAWMFTIGGPLVFLVGFRQYRQMRDAIAFEEERLTKEKKLFSLRALHFPSFLRKHEYEPR